MISTTGTAHRLRAAVEAAGHLAPPTLVRVISDTAHGLRDVDLFDRAMTLAAQAFTSLFPLIIAMATLRAHGDKDALQDHLANSLSLPDSSRAVLGEALPDEPETLGTFGVLGFFIVLVSATSFSRALARMYGKVWRVRPTGFAGGWRWLAVLIGVVLSILALRAVHRAASGHIYRTIGELLVTLTLNTLLWTWVPWLLLARNVAWRRLLPGGVLMGLGTLVTSLVSGVYLPRAVASASQQYGAFGVAFTYIGWMFAVGFVLIVSTVLGWVLANDVGIIGRFAGRLPKRRRADREAVLPDG